MTKILKYSDYIVSEIRAEELIDNICKPYLNESKDDGEFESIAKKLSKDLKFNFKLILTFGTGIKMMIPVVQNLIKNQSLSFEMTQENLILLAITIAAIVYLEETSNQAGDEINKSGQKSLVTKSDAQSLLEELRMRGIGQGIVKKFASAFQSVGKFFKMLFRSTPYVVNGLLDMLGYTALLIPCMNALSAFIGKYDINLENLAANLLSLGVGVGTILAKQGVTWLVDKIKNSLNLNKVNPELENPNGRQLTIYDIIDTETDNVDRNKLIKEQ